MNDLLVNSTRSIRNWISIYEEQGVIAFQPSSRNKSYSKEFKVTMVEKYLRGESSVIDLCAKYGIKAHQTLRKWISLYNSNMELKDYDPKQEVYMASARRKTIINDRDYKVTAEKYGVSYSQVYSWVKKYDQIGEEGLSDKRGQHKTDEEVDELEKLRRENRRLKQQLEERDRTVELLKKVKEFERRRF